MLIKALGVGKVLLGALFVCLWVVLSGAWGLGCRWRGLGPWCRWRCVGPGAVFLVLDGALVEGEANGVNAIAKISRRIEAFAGKHVA